MQFCPKCGNILVPKKDKKGLFCACGYFSRQKAKDIVIKEEIYLDKKDEIEVIDKKIDTFPRTNEECPKCGNMSAYHWSVQTRAGDEAETRFFECTKCRHRWRRYD